jgi:hypothetical protein
MGIRRGRDFETPPKIIQKVELFQACKHIDGIGQEIGVILRDLLFSSGLGR